MTTNETAPGEGGLATTTMQNITNLPPIVNGVQHELHRQTVEDLESFTISQMGRATGQSYPSAQIPD